MNKSQLIEVAKQNPSNYFIIISHVYAYAEGVTGRSYYFIIFAGPENKGFGSRMMAESFLKEKKKEGKYVTRVNKATRLGDYYNQHVVRGSKIEQFINDNVYANISTWIEG